ncbi:MAG: hypothetical protein WDZ85_01110 [Candidatus Paceibacterota bacterium]
MNEFSAKKLGEVLAFATVSLETGEKGEVALREALGDDLFNDLIDRNQNYRQTINHLAEKYEVTGIVNKKLDGTGFKLRNMRDTYIGDDWDNPVEQLEWSGFFVGAAIVHWDLITGVAEKLNDEKITDLATDALAFHRRLFEIVENKLQDRGREAAGN